MLFRSVGVAKALEAPVVFEYVEKGCASSRSDHATQSISIQCAIEPVLTERRSIVGAGPVRRRQAADGDCTAPNRAIQGCIFCEVKACFFAAGSQFYVPGWVSCIAAENGLKTCARVEKSIGRVGVVKKIVACCGSFRSGLGYQLFSFAQFIG